MEVILYSTGCPKCKVIESKLNNKNIQFQVISDVAAMEALGFQEAPVLDVNGEKMDFVTANRWVNNQ